MPESQAFQPQLAQNKLSMQQQARKKYKHSMVSKVEQGMVFQLADGAILACNPAAEHILGVTKEQFTGWNSLETSWRAICEDGSPFLNDAHPAMVALRTGKPCENVVMGLYKPSGELVWVLLSSEPLFQAGNSAPYAVVTSFTDVTASAVRQIEAHFYDLADAIPEIVFSTNAQGQADFVNQRWEEYTGLSLEESTGYGWIKALHPNDLGSIVQPLQVALHNGKPYENEHRFQRASDGTYRWHLVRGLPLKDDQGRVVKWVGTCTDIHEKKQIQEEQKQMLQQEQAARLEAETANRIKEQFLAVLSHELRSPLNPILGWTKLLKSRNFDKVTAERALDIIERNAKLQIQLIDDLLDVSRILRGKLSLNFATVDLVSVIDAALETVRLTAETKSVDLKFLLAPTLSDKHGDFQLGANSKNRQTNEFSELPNIKLKPHGVLSEAKKLNSQFQVSGDFYRLQQVVGNLLNNAVKFTPSGGRIEVRLSVVKEEAGETGEAMTTLSPSSPSSPSTLGTQNLAVIQVIDTGSGISPEFLPHVFEYFRQADSSTTRQFGGLGLGLAIVHHLVQLHNGRVAAYSAGKGQGATFTIKLPLMETPKVVEPDNSQAVACPNLEGLKILIVDDDADTREFLSFLLEQYKAKTVVVSSANEAYAAMKQTQPDLLLSDLGMPEVDGYSLIRQIRALSPKSGGQIPAIALTAYATETDQERVFAAGFQKHLAKPVEPDKLLASIKDLLGQKC